MLQFPCILTNICVFTKRTNYRGGRWIDQGALEYEGHALNRKIVMDYGLIVRSYNPFTSRDHTTILFAGSHTYGTIAAAKFFTEDLHKHLGKLTHHGRKNLAILVSAHISMQTSLTPSP